MADPRPSRLPPEVEPYRTIGPFDAETLPAGLRRTHSLKEGSWGRIDLTQGELLFVWEDDQDGEERLCAPAELVVPPQAPHHVAPVGQIELTITFYRKPGT